ENKLPMGPLNPGLAAQPFLTGVQLQTSSDVGLHPQLLHYDVTTSDGFNIGGNPVITIPPNGKATYTWYAGTVDRLPNGSTKYTPVEFGAVNLAPADPLMQSNFGLIGALIIEPQYSVWHPDDNTRAAGTVTRANNTPLFREAVAIVQDDLANADPAINYRTEPFSYRYQNP